MKYREFGTTGRMVPAVGQGTWPVPDVEALRYGISLGLTHIDTAEMYGDGRSEELTGAAIAGIARDDLFLVSKLLPRNGLRADAKRSCERSLRRMGIEYFDCYLLHWRGDVDLRETMQALEELQHEGKTRAIGVSNLDPWDMREAAAALSTAAIACNQVLYNLAERTVETHEYPVARGNGQALVAYTPLGGISGDAAAVLEAIARRHQTGPQAIALAFLLRLEGVFVIPKASQPAHVAANAAAADIVLTPEDLRAIEAAFPRAERTGPLPMN